MGRGRRACCGAAAAAAAAAVHTKASAQLLPQPGANPAAPPHPACPAPGPVKPMKLAVTISVAVMTFILHCRPGSGPCLGGSAAED